MIAIIIMAILRKLQGGSREWGVSAQDAMLYQNGCMSHEKQWMNDLHIYLE